MSEVIEHVELKIGDGKLTIPAESLVLAWLTQALTRPAELPAPTAATMPPRIGSEWPGQGGMYAGVIRGEPGRPDYHLIVPTSPDAEVESITYGPADQVVDGANSEYDGRANTLSLVNAGGHPAADWAHSLQIGPHDDFYLPSRRELRLLWTNVPELFTKAWYWSSTQYAPLPFNAWGQNFGNGNQSYYHKSYAGRARAVRRLIIQ